jgi:hypothetical protein
MIRHIVLFKVKSDTSQDLLNAFITNIKSLEAIAGVSKVIAQTHNRCR